MATTPKTLTKSTNETVQLSQLEMLRGQADLMGVSYGANLSERALRKLLLDTLNADQDGGTYTNEERLTLEQDSKRLIRCVITPIDPLLKEHDGEFFSVANSVLQFNTKFVMFNTEYHVPKILLDHIKAQEFQFFVTTVVDGKKVRTPKMGKKFSVVELAPLTKEELADLAQNQMARQAIDA